MEHKKEIIPQISSHRCLYGVWYLDTCSSNMLWVSGKSEEMREVDKRRGGREAWGEERLFLLIFTKDSYHYITTWYSQNENEKIQQKDNIFNSPLLDLFYFHFFLFCFSARFFISHYSLLAVLIDLMFSRIKRVKALLQGLCLIIVPCWWDGTIGRYTLSLILAILPSTPTFHVSLAPLPPFLFKK